MAFTPILNLPTLAAALDDLERLRDQVGELDVPAPLARWLTRYVEARGAHMSTRIEGNPMTERDVLELFEDDPTSAEGRYARENLDYRDAARFATQFADDATADIDGGFVRALHYLTVRTTLRYPTEGQYRTLQNEVRAGTTRIYLPPPPGEVGRRMTDLIAWLREQRGQLHALILAAVAHAEFVKIHPFDDGNGRTARALSVYFMARGGWRLRGFVGVEQVFGEDIDGYRDMLNSLGATYRYDPLDLTPWVDWFLQRLRFELSLDLQVAQQYEEVVTEIAPAALAARDLPARMTHIYGLIWLDGSVGASDYAAATRITGPTAASDLRRLVDMGVLRRVGRGRNTRYEPAELGLVLDRVALRREAFERLGTAG